MAHPVDIYLRYLNFISSFDPFYFDIFFVLFMIDNLFSQKIVLKTLAGMHTIPTICLLVEHHLDHELTIIFAYTRHKHSATDAGIHTGHNLM